MGHKRQLASSETSGNQSISTATNRLVGIRVPKPTTPKISWLHWVQGRTSYQRRTRHFRACLLVIVGCVCVRNMFHSSSDGIYGRFFLFQEQGLVQGKKTPCQ